LLAPAAFPLPEDRPPVMMGTGPPQAWERPASGPLAPPHAGWARLGTSSRFVLCGARLPAPAAVTRVAHGKAVSTDRLASASA